MKRKLILTLAATLATTALMAQENNNNDDKITLSGSIQSDVIIPQEDKKIGTEKYSEWALTNTYADIDRKSVV